MEINRSKLDKATYQGQSAGLASTRALKVVAGCLLSTHLDGVKVQCK